MRETQVQHLGREDLLEKGMATHSSVLAPSLQKWGSKKYFKGFPGSSEVKASACNVGDSGSIPGLGRSPGEGTGNPLQCACPSPPKNGVQRSILRASLGAQRLKRLPAMWATRVWSLGWEDPLEKEMATYSRVLAWRIPWREEPGELQSMGSQELDTTEWLHFTSLKAVSANLYFFPP